MTSVLKLGRIIATTAVFVLFVYLGTWRAHTPRSREATNASQNDSVSSAEIVKPHPKDIRDLALALPDSLLPFCRGLKSLHEIALSFDACPTSGKNHFNKAIANILLQTKTPATVFLSGRWVEEDTAATLLLASDSLIELGNHSYTHPHMMIVSLDRMRRELERTQKIITDLTGQVPFLFRAPYGEFNDTLINVGKELGLVTVQFDVESGDPDTTFTAQRLIKWVTEKARNGSIIIMHINDRGWHTAQALPAIIQFLREKGYKLVKVSDLMKEVSESLPGGVVAHVEASGSENPPKEQ